MEEYIYITFSSQAKITGYFYLEYSHPIPPTHKEQYHTPLFMYYKEVEE